MKSCSQGAELRLGSEKRPLRGGVLPVPRLLFVLLAALALSWGSARAEDGAEAADSSALTKDSQREALQEAYALCAKLDAPETAARLQAPLDWTEADLELLEQARSLLETASQGPDSVLSARAVDQLAVLPAPALVRARQFAAEDRIDEAWELYVSAWNAVNAAEIDMELGYLTLRRLSRLAEDQGLGSVREAVATEAGAALQEEAKVLFAAVARRPHLRLAQAARIELGYRLLDEGEQESASELFWLARDGPDSALERRARVAQGFLAIERLELDEAAAVLDSAAADADPENAADVEAAAQASALRETLGERWLDLGHLRLSEADMPAAQAAFDRAEQEGCDPQKLAIARASLELGRLVAVVEAEGLASTAEALETEAGAAHQAAAIEFLTQAAEGPDPLWVQAARLDLAYRALDAGELDTAVEHFEAAEQGPDGVRVRRARIGLGFLASERLDLELATELLDAAAADPDPTNSADQEAADDAAALRATLGERWLDRGYSLMEDGENVEAQEAFERAEEEGADSQRVATALGDVLWRRGRLLEARKRLRDAREGPDPELSDAARLQLRSIPSFFWADAYLELFGWSRLWPERFDDLAASLRVRGFIHPFGRVDVDPYIFVQLSGDVASRAAALAGVPESYADNTFMVGGGVLARFWKKRIGVYIQVGAAVPLILEEPESPVELDFRVGAHIGLDSEGCRPSPQRVPGSLTGMAALCAEFYGEATYVSRFRHNVFFMTRGRLGAHYLVTGPVAWGPVGEVRIFKDIRNDFYNNLFDVGVGHRWRLLKPFGLDLMVGVHTGSYFGLESVDPAPEPLGYLDLRMQLMTYVAF